MSFGLSAAAIGGIAAGVGAIGGAVISSKAAGKASRAQSDAARDANATELAMFDQNREDAAPYRNTGYQALNALNEGFGFAPSGPNGTIAGEDPRKVGGSQFKPSEIVNMRQQGWSLDQILQAGVLAPGQGSKELRYLTQAGFTPDEINHLQNGTFTTPNPAEGAAKTPGGGTTGDNYFTHDFALSDFVKDPGYEFRRSEGQKGVEAGASARGGVLSGAALKGVERYNQDYASGEYSNAYNRFNNDRTTRFNRLSALAGTGQTAVTNVANLGARTADNIAENTLQAGNARASGYIGQANAVNNGIQTLGNFYLQRQYAPKPTAPSISV